jgi:hypothetical protein
MGFRTQINVANPSSYFRSDYVEVDLKSYKMPIGLNEKNLRLYRYFEENKSKKEIPFQIDNILGTDGQHRLITFISENTLPGKDDYSTISAQFILEEDKDGSSFFPLEDKAIWIGNYYSKPIGDEPKDGFNKRWFANREMNGVKLNNGNIELYFQLLPIIHPQKTLDLSGSVTSLLSRQAAQETGAGEILSPFNDCEEKKWGQITDLVFFPSPRNLKWFQKISMKKIKYQVIWSNCGTMRAIVALKSDPIEIEFDGKPFFSPSTVKIMCSLFRVLYVYPNKPYYMEELFVQSENGVSISFRPYFCSFLCYPDSTPISSQLARFEHIPDYFAFWKGCSYHHRGYGFSSDTHIRGINLNGDEIHWRLPLTHHNKCIHYFMFHGYPPNHIDPFHEIGHYAWYEKMFKPLEAVPLKPRYPKPIPTKE